MITCYLGSKIDLVPLVLWSNGLPCPHVLHAAGQSQSGLQTGIVFLRLGGLFFLLFLSLLFRLRSMKEADAYKVTWLLLECLANKLS